MLKALHEISELIIVSVQCLNEEKALSHLSNEPRLTKVQGVHNQMLQSYFDDLVI